MLSSITVAMVTAAISPSIPLPDMARAECRGETYSVREFRRYATPVYRRDRVTNKARQRMRMMQRCAYNKRRARRMERWRDRRYRERQERLRIQHQRAAVTPYGPFAIPPDIVECESDGWRDVNTSNPERPAGRYQIITKTWLAYGGGAFAPTADLATPLQQSIIATRIWAGGRGRGHWEC